MGEFIALIDVIPDDTDADIDALVKDLKKVLPDTCVIEHHDILPVAVAR